MCACSLKHLPCVVIINAILSFMLKRPVYGIGPFLVDKKFHDLASTSD